MLIPRPTPLPTGMRGWLNTFADPFCAALPSEERGAFLDEVTVVYHIRGSLYFHRKQSGSNVSVPGEAHCL